MPKASTLLVHHSTARCASRLFLEWPSSPSRVTDDLSRPIQHESVLTPALRAHFPRTNPFASRDTGIDSSHLVCLSYFGIVGERPKRAQSLSPEKLIRPR